MTRCINLDPMFIPIPYPEIEFNSLQFSAGEQHIRLSNSIDYTKIKKVIITHRYQGDRDIMKIILTVSALEGKGIDNNKVDLVLPYMPYARQDRYCHAGDAFSLDMVTYMLNQMGFNKVTILDAHSKVTEELLDNCRNLDNKQYVARAIKSLKHFTMTLISPDAGAKQKSIKLFNDIKQFTRLVHCKKTRDPKTGRLSGFEVVNRDLYGQPCIIVDDICDGGGTFIGTAKELKKKNAGDLYLFVTHGIFSHGIAPLLEGGFKHVFSTNSMGKNWSKCKQYTEFKIQL